MNLFDLYAKIALDDSEFNKSVKSAMESAKNVEKAVKSLQSPLANAQKAFNAIAHPVETAKSAMSGLMEKTEDVRHPIETLKNKILDASTALETQRNKMAILASAYEGAQFKVKDLTEQFNKAAKESGITSDETKELASKLDEAEKEASQAKTALDEYARSVNDAGKKSEETSEKTGKLAEKLKTGLATASKVGAAAIGAASTAIGALGKIGLDYNSQMEQYTTNFTTMLGSQEAAVQKVQELKEFAASTPLSMDDLAKGTQTLLAFGVESENSTGILRQLGDIALGDADKMQRLSTAFGKATAAGKVTGDTVQQMIDAGWNPLIQISQSAGETMEETQKRMSAGKISVEELQAAMEAVTSGTGQFAGGMEAASHTTQGLISTLQDNARALVGEVFQPISDGLLGQVLPGAIEAISGLTTAFRENGISGMIEAAGGIVGSAIGEFTNALPQFVNTAVEIVKSLVTGIKDNLPQIAEGAVTTVETLADGIIDMLPSIIETGLKLIVALANSLITHLPQLIVKIPEIIRAIVRGFSQGMPNIIEIGKNIVKGVWQGIKSLAGWIKDNVKGFFGDIVTGAKNALGIHSPSTVFAGIGENMALGLGEGWDDEYGRISKNIKSGLDFGTATVDFDSSGLGGMSKSMERKNSSSTIINQYIQGTKQSPSEIAGATKAMFTGARYALR